MDGFLVPTGSIIKEYLDERSISQKDLSGRIDVSEKQISKLLNGKARLTEEMALKLEKVMPDIEASYWLNYESQYREWLARLKEQEELEGADLQAIAKRFRFKDVFAGMGLSLVQQANEMLKILGVSSFNQYLNACPSFDIDFMQDNGASEAIVVWLRLCDLEVEKQNPDICEEPYSSSALRKALPVLKTIALNEDIESSLQECRRFMNKLGIFFVYHEPIPGAKVRGALYTHGGRPCICVSGRFKSHDHTWFAIFHEVAHLLLHYTVKRSFVTMEDEQDDSEKEEEANKFARSALIDIDAFEEFALSSERANKSAIRRFAQSQGVAPGVVLGFLQHDGYVEYGGSLEALKSKTRR